jgi:RNA polymerase sigma-70 factor (ECF subfamily)
LGADIANDARIAWIGDEILPHERDVRSWLRRSSFRAMDPDDLIQEAYARIAAAELGEVACGRAYFFRTVRNLALEQVRRSRIVQIDAMADIERLSIEDEEPSPERIAAGRVELARIAALIEELPRKCRQVFIMRKVQALSQKEIAARLNISENTVETHAVKGLRLILERIAGESATSARAPARRSAHEPPAKRKRD